MSKVNTVDVHSMAPQGCRRDDNPDKLSRDLGFMMIQKMLSTATVFL